MSESGSSLAGEPSGAFPAVSEPKLTDVYSPGWRGEFFWRLMVATAAVFVLAAAAFNYLINPFSLYGTELIPRPMGMYEKKLSLYHDFKPPPRALILGSSRVMSCDPLLVTELTGERCFNLWLPGAGAETLYAVMRLVLEEDGAPIDLVIVGVGVETLHPALPIQPEARFMSEMSRYFTHDPHGEGTGFDKLGLLFTMDQTLQSSRLLLGAVRGPLRGDEDQAGLSKLDYREDGFTVQARSEEEIAAGTFDLEAKIESRLRRKRYTERGLVVSGWDGPSPIRVAYWEDLLALCADRGIRVYAFMTPAHPRMSALLDELGAERVFKQVSDYFSSSIGEVGGTFRDYTRLESFGGDPNIFYDEMHMRSANCDILLRHLLSGYAGEESD
jgi:hypothetical protein